MKKLIALLLALCLIFSLCACGAKVDPGPQVAEDQPQADEDGPGGLEDVSDEPVENEVIDPYPGKKPLGGETASGQIVEITDTAELEYIGSKVVADDYGNPVLLSWFNFSKTGDYEDTAAWCMTYYAYQNDEELWPSSYTYNGEDLSETCYVELFPGESMEICFVYDLTDMVNPVTFTFNDVWEELEPIELTVELSEVEKCIEAAESIVGFFAVNYLLEGDLSADYDELVAQGMADNTYVEFFEDGTAVFCFNGYEYDMLYDADYVYIDDDVYYYTLEDDYFTIEGSDVYYEYIRVEEVVEEPVEEHDFVGETVYTTKGYVSVTLDKGWYVDEGEHGNTLVLYHEDLGITTWVKIADNQLTTLEQEMEYTQLALADSVYEEVTIGGNTYQKLFDDEWLPLMYLIGVTSTGKSFYVEVRNVYPEDVMTMLESIEVY